MRLKRFQNIKLLAQLELAGLQLIRVTPSSSKHITISINRMLLPVPLQRRTGSFPKCVRSALCTLCFDLLSPFGANPPTLRAFIRSILFLILIAIWKYAFMLNLLSEQTPCLFHSCDQKNLLSPVITFGHTLFKSVSKLEI